MFYHFSVKVRDHDHLTGSYRGAAHSRCNLQLRKQYKFPVFLHNFRGYDAHLITMGLDFFPQSDIKIIGQGMEKYLTMQFGDHIVFKDSLMFLSCSLERLGKNLLAAGRDNFKYLLNDPEFSRYSDAEVDLLLRKGVYPYDYMDSWAKFADDRLPQRESFYNRLRDAECSVEDYAHAQNVWRTFHCDTMEEYHDLYLKSMLSRISSIQIAYLLLNFKTFKENNICSRYHILLLV